MSSKIGLAIAMTSVLLSIVALSESPTKEANMLHATGTFDVKINPQSADNSDAKAANIGRNSWEKQFKGALVGFSHGEMLYTGDPATSGAYVALEKVTGSLQGRSGSFVFLHSAVMNRGTPQDWVVRVVPDSGTDELQGLQGTLTIVIEGGSHSYDFAYSLEKADGG